MQHFGPSLPTHTFDWPQFWFIRHLFLPRKTQAWSGLKACTGCGVPHLLCWHPHPVATGSPTEHTFPTPSPDPTSQHQVIMHEQLGFWKAAGLECSNGMYHLLAKRVQNGARMANGAHAALPPRIFLHSLTVCNIYTCCTRLGLKMGPASGRKFHLAMFGGVQW